MKSVPKYNCLFFVLALTHVKTLQSESRKGEITPRVKHKSLGFEPNPRLGDVHDPSEMLWKTKTNATTTTTTAATATTTATPFISKTTEIVCCGLHTVVNLSAPIYIAMPSQRHISMFSH